MQRRELAMLAAVVVLAAAAYVPSLSSGFVWDDHLHVRQNSFITRLGNIPKAFTVDSDYDDMRPNTKTPYYRPLVPVSYMLDHAMWEKRPAGYHLTNLLLHALSAALLFMLLRSLTGTAAAVWGAALFSVHPVCVEVVSYVGARGDLIATAGALGALIAHVRHRQDGRKGVSAASLLLYGMALLGKESVVLLPVVVFMLDLVVLGGGVRRALLSLSASGMVAAMYVIVRTSVVGTEGWYEPEPVRQLLTAPGVTARSLVLLFLPAAVQPFYDLPIIKEFALGDVGLPLAGLASYGAVAALAVRRAPAAGVLLLAVPVLYLPASNLIALLYPALLANRYLYLPCAMAAGAAGWMLSRVIGLFPRHRAVLVASCSLVAASCLFLTLRYQTVYDDELSLWSSAARVAPRSAYVLNKLGMELMKRDRFGEAEAVFLEALKHHPDDTIVRHNIGRLFLDEGRVDEGVLELSRLISLAPDNVEAHVELGLVALEREQCNDAEFHFREALRRIAGCTDAIFMLAVTHLGCGESVEAEREFWDAIACNTHIDEAYHNIGRIYLDEGQYDDAVAFFKRAVAIDPANESFRIDLDRAVKLLRTTPRRPWWQVKP